MASASTLACSAPRSLAGFLPTPAFAFVAIAAVERPGIALDRSAELAQRSPLGSGAAPVLDHAAVVDATSTEIVEQARVRLLCEQRHRAAALIFARRVLGADAVARDLLQLAAPTSPRSEGVVHSATADREHGLAIRRDVRVLHRLERVLAHLADTIDVEVADLLSASDGADTDFEPCFEQCVVGTLPPHHPRFALAELSEKIIRRRCELNDRVDVRVPSVVRDQRAVLAHLAARRPGHLLEHHAADEEGSQRATAGGLGIETRALRCLETVERRATALFVVTELDLRQREEGEMRQPSMLAPGAQLGRGLALPIRSAHRTPAIAAAPVREADFTVSVFVDAQRWMNRTAVSDTSPPRDPVARQAQRLAVVARDAARTSFAATASDISAEPRQHPCARHHAPVLDQGVRVEAGGRCRVSELPRRELGGVAIESRLPCDDAPRLIDLFIRSTTTT